MIPLASQMSDAMYACGRLLGKARDMRADSASYF